VTILPADPVTESRVVSDDLQDLPVALSTADPVAVDRDAIADVCFHRDLRDTRSRP
jgi:hypothetical protein